MVAFSFFGSVDFVFNGGGCLDVPSDARGEEGRGVIDAPEGEAAAHVVGFTNVEDKGQEGDLYLDHIF